MVAAAVSQAVRPGRPQGKEPGPQSSVQPKQPGACFKCGLPGHWSCSCPNPRPPTNPPPHAAVVATGSRIALKPLKAQEHPLSGPSQTPRRPWHQQMELIFPSWGSSALMNNEGARSRHRPPLPPYA
ncbi:hypothetical protein mRhiFer1_009689 [Rhinolophus ferrumequinum]|uniref:CCHC-type domain-containing protein n=1 Tax=Rhinolophus ferrumequinum TaxID=59479 RepID=A0A7J7R285_RHIFE|nr:hypothetical protein mRhiFer1_009689 [Rhinolophus ferrumequinum]